MDVRVLSSTSKNLPALIETNNFREELYHRLNVVPIEVPSLEERREDIPELASHFIAEFNRSQGLAERVMGQEAEALLQTMKWPGNIRQLKNMIEQLLILGDGTTEISAAELPAQKGQNSGEEVTLSAAVASRVKCLNGNTCCLRSTVSVGILAARQLLSGWNGQHCIAN